MSNLNSLFGQVSSVDKTPAVVEDYPAEKAAGLHVISLNIAPAGLDNEEVANDRSGYLTTNFGGIFHGKFGAFFKGYLPTIHTWSHETREWIRPNAAKQEGNGVMVKNEEPRGLLKAYYMASKALVEQLQEVSIEDNDTALYERCQQILTSELTPSWLASQPVNFDLPDVSESKLAGIRRALYEKVRIAASNRGRKGESLAESSKGLKLQSRVVLAVSISFPEGIALRPIFKVSHVISWDEEVLPLDQFDSSPLTIGDMAAIERLHLSEFHTEEAEKLRKRERASAALTLFGGLDGKSRGTSGYKARQQYRADQGRKAEAMQESVGELPDSTPPVFNMDSMLEDDMED